MPENAIANDTETETSPRKPHVRRFLGVCLDGYPFIVLALLINLGLLVWTHWMWGALFAGLTIWVVSFFRDPERHGPEDPKAILSPADGKVIGIQEMDYPRLVDGPAVRVSIFMSVFNVHVNRIPCAGVVRGIHYNPGKYFAAYAEKASLLNEQSTVWLKTPSGKDVVWVQIAGLVARRIINRLSLNESIPRGKRFGLIRFGSRVDLYLPKGTEIVTKLGETVRAGSSVLGRWA